MDKRGENHFTAQEKQMANKHLKKYSALLYIKEIQIKNHREMTLHVHRDGQHEEK